MGFHLVEPEVAGGHGRGTRYDRSTVPVTVTALEYRFDGWLGDALLESTPCFIVTEDLARSIERLELTGVHFDTVSVSISSKGREFMDTELPTWKWLKLTGRAGESDFALNDELCLVVSDRALKLLQEAGIHYADVVALGPPSGS
ncbi:hypothetical protein ACFVUS_20840 [Nocardia sp. NPDC058058]|uniref:hypothetical protein n=1 Tax=Nocardia sp. NPDC058058 TaxID=3346317 RepID=UPI0036D99E92